MSKISKRFSIDFFEFSFLLEACLNGPIARMTFFYDTIDKYYYQLTKEERKLLYEWMNKNSYYNNLKENSIEHILLWDARYNPENQYKVTSNFEGNEKVHETFLYQDKYHTERFKSIIEDYIIKIENV